MITRIETRYVAILTDTEIGLGTHRGRNKGWFTSVFEEWMITHAFFAVGSTGTVTMYPDILTVVFLLAYQNVRHIVEKVGFNLSTQDFLCSFYKVVGNSSAVGMGEVGAGFASIHVELSIGTITIKGDKGLFLTMVGLANLFSYGIDGFTMRSTPEEATKVHEDSCRKMLTLLGSEHIHRVLTKDAGTTMNHEQILTFFEVEFFCYFRVDNISHLHEVEEVIAGSTDDT